jgi:catechol 2,3-dioxygenase-like lactoylglutathione lyase family enzyme
VTSGSRLPEDAHPGRVRLEVASVLRSVAWYRDVLGLVPLEASFRRAVLGPPLVQDPWGTGLRLTGAKG